MPLLNHDKLKAHYVPPDYQDVTLQNCHIGMRVRRGRTWNNAWRDDIDKNFPTIPNFAKPRVSGRIVGFTDARGTLVGINSGRQFEIDCITSKNGPGWAVVTWRTAITSIYPIGAEDCHSLVTDID